MKLRISKKILVNLLIVLAVGIVVYFPRFFNLDTKGSGELTFTYGSDELTFTEVFTYAGCTSPACALCWDSGCYSCSPNTGLDCPGTLTCALKANCICSAQNVWCDDPPDLSWTCQGGTCTEPVCPQTIQGVDDDGDTWQTVPPGGSGVACDCVDTNPLVFPNNSMQMCDCDSTTGCNYFSCSAGPDTATAMWGEGNPEITDCSCGVVTPCSFKLDADCWCNNGRDDDCDGLIDYFDSDCPQGLSTELVVDAITWTMSPSGSCPSRRTNFYSGIWVINGGHLIVPPCTDIIVKEIPGVTVIGGTDDIHLEGSGSEVATIGFIP